MQPRHLRRAAVLLAVVLVAGASGCKRRPSYDTSTPDATLESFRNAIDHGDIPRDVSRLVSDETEQQRWKLRCQQQHCRKATFRVVDRGQETSYRAVLHVEYEVLGDADVRLIWGKRTPVHFAREGGRWYITQFGDEVVIPPAPPPAGQADAGAAAGDGGGPAE